MEKVKEIINNPKKTAIIGLVASILILINNLTVRSSYALYVYIIALIPSIALAIYYITICLKLYRNKGNVIVARNILVIAFFIKLIFDIIQTILSRYGSSNILGILIEAYISIYLYFLLYKSSFMLSKSKNSNKVFAFVVVGNNLYSLIILLNYGYFSVINLCLYILNIASLLYFYSYYEELKKNNNETIKEDYELKENNIEDKTNYEFIGLSKENNEEIDKETRAKLYQVYCNEVIKTLKAPSTAVFCKEEELIITREYGRYVVSGWVDSQNSYGAMIRTYYNKFQIENQNGVFIPKSNARMMASNKIAGTLAGYWIYGIIATIITGAIFYFIISATM